MHSPSRTWDREQHKWETEFGVLWVQSVEAALAGQRGAETAEEPTGLPSEEGLTRPGQGSTCKPKSANPQLLTIAEAQAKRLQTTTVIVFSRGIRSRICIYLMPDATFPRPSSGRVWDKIRLAHIRRGRRPVQSTFAPAWLGLGRGPSRRQLPRLWQRSGTSFIRGHRSLHHSISLTGR